MEWTLEVIVVPVSDVERAKWFYVDRCGFRCDVDATPAEGVRFVQLTPPGSRCSIALQQGLPPGRGQRAMAPGSLPGLQMCVTDIEVARAELADRGLDAGPVRHVGANGWEEGKGTETWNSFLVFQDPDGNGWVAQEAPAPLAER